MLYKIVNGELIPKKVYETELDAVTMARFLNSRENVIHKICKKCNKWHIGNNGRLLTKEDREKYNEKLKLERHYIKQSIGPTARIRDCLSCGESSILLWTAKVS